MTTQLKLYNRALRNLKERRLANLTEATKARFELDSVWDGGEFITQVLEQGYWNFAIRTAKFTPDPDFTASFGYRNRFTIPSDFVRLVAMCEDEYFNVPHNRYTEEAGNWFSDLNELYVSYISDDNDYGANLDRWPESFTSYVELQLADEVAGVLTGDADMVKDDLRKALVDARAKDAMNEPTKFMPQGRFTQARMGGHTGRDRGRRGSLIG